jgi:nicotinate-nucleotide adenylyltransferase
MSGPRAIGVFGGSFNPPHLGHLAIASDACALLDLERVVFVPAAAPVHRPVEDDVPPETRVEMTRLAVAGDERFAVSTIEIELGLRYTLDVVTELRRRLAPAPLFFLLGSDSLAQFGAWHDPAAILERCRLAVAPRPGDDRSGIERVAAGLGSGKVAVLHSAVLDISSSMIRDRLRRGLPIRYLVPAAVEGFVRDHGLYRAAM